MATKHLVNWLEHSQTIKYINMRVFVTLVVITVKSSIILALVLQHDRRMRKASHRQQIKCVAERRTYIVVKETFVRRIKCELPCPTMLGDERDEYD